MAETAENAADDEAREVLQRGGSITEDDVLRVLRHLFKTKRAQKRWATVVNGGVLGATASRLGPSAGTTHLKARDFCWDRTRNVSRLLLHWLGQDLLDLIRPTSIQINRNFTGPIHVDGNNVGHSAIRALGPYVGGQLWLEDAAGDAERDLVVRTSAMGSSSPQRKPGIYRGRLVDVRGRFHVFEGSTHLHGSAHVQPDGERFTIVFYSMDRASLARLTAEDREQLEECGFKPRVEAEAGRLEAQRNRTPQHDDRLWDQGFLAFCSNFREAEECDLRSRGEPLLEATGALKAKWRALEERGDGSRDFWRGVEAVMRQSRAAQLKARRAAPKDVAAVATPQQRSRVEPGARAGSSSGHEQPGVVDVNDEEEGEEELDLDMFAKLVLEEFSVSFHNLDTFRDLLDLFGIPPDQEIRGRAFRAWEKAVQVRKDEAVARRMQDGSQEVVVEIEESQQGSGCAASGGAGPEPPPKRARSWSEFQGTIAVDSQGASEQGGSLELAAAAGAAEGERQSAGAASAPAVVEEEPLQVAGGGGGATGAAAGPGLCCPCSPSAGGRDEALSAEALAELPPPGAAADEGDSFGPDSDSECEVIDCRGPPLQG